MSIHMSDGRGGFRQQPKPTNGQLEKYVRQLEYEIVALRQMAKEFDTFMNYVCQNNGGTFFMETTKLKTMTMHQIKTEIKDPNTRIIDVGVAKYEGPHGMEFKVLIPEPPQDKKSCSDNEQH